MHEREQQKPASWPANLTLLPDVPPAARFSVWRCLAFGIGLALAIAGLGMMASALSLLTAGTLPAHAQTSEPIAVGYRLIVVPDYARERPLGLAASAAEPEETAAQLESLPPGQVTGHGLEQLEASVLGMQVDNVRVQALSVGPLISASPRQPQVPADARAPAPAGQGTQVPPPAPVVALATPEPISVARAQLTPLRRIEDVDITFYDCRVQGFCGHMANGHNVYEGAAACSYDLPLGTRFYIVGDPTNRIYRCDDRGLLRRTWVDIFWYDPIDGWRWQELVGRWGTIVVLEWGDGG
jgi:hypothetical protein